LDSETKFLLQPRRFSDADYFGKLRRDSEFVVERSALFDERENAVRSDEIDVGKFRIAPEFF
jgi:hypothetical protein